MVMMMMTKRSRRRKKQKQRRRTGAPACAASHALQKKQNQSVWVRGGGIPQNPRKKRQNHTHKKKDHRNISKQSREHSTSQERQHSHVPATSSLTCGEVESCAARAIASWQRSSSHKTIFRVLKCATYLRYRRLGSVARAHAHAEAGNGKHAQTPLKTSSPQTRGVAKQERDNDTETKTNKETTKPTKLQPPALSRTTPALRAMTCTAPHQTQHMHMHMQKQMQMQMHAFFGPFFASSPLRPATPRQAHAPPPTYLFASTCVTSTR